MIKIFGVTHTYIIRELPVWIILLFNILQDAEEYYRQKQKRRYREQNDQKNDGWCHDTQGIGGSLLILTGKQE